MVVFTASGVLMYLQETDAAVRGKTSAILVHDIATWVAVPLIAGHLYLALVQPVDAPLAAGDGARHGAARLGPPPPPQVGRVNNRGLAPVIHAPGRKAATARRISPGRSIHGKWPQPGMVVDLGAADQRRRLERRRRRQRVALAVDEERRQRADGRPVASVLSRKWWEIDAFVAVEQATPMRPARMRRRRCGIGEVARPDEARALHEVGLGGLAAPRGGLRSRRSGRSARRLSCCAGSLRTRANTRSNAPSGSMQTTPSSRSGWATSRCSARWPPHEWPTAHARSIAEVVEHGHRVGHVGSIVYGPPTVEGGRAALGVAVGGQQAGELRGAALGVVRPGRAAVQQERGRPAAAAVAGEHAVPDRDRECLLAHPRDSRGTIRPA